MAKTEKAVRYTARINIPLSVEERKKLDQAVPLRMEKAGVRIGTVTEWARQILMDAVDDILEKAKKS